MLREDEGKEEDDEDETDCPYLFYVGDEQVRVSLRECLKQVLVNKERTLPIVYKPQAVFRSDKGQFKPSKAVP